MEKLFVDTNPQSPPPLSIVLSGSPGQAPLIIHLFHEVSDKSEGIKSELEDPVAYDYSMLAISETITVPYKLCSGKTTIIVWPS